MALTKVGPKIAPVLTLALFVLGGMAVRDVTNNAPAFNEDLTITGITGDTRLQQTGSMYDEGTYLMQIGYGYLNADVLSFGGIEGPDEVATLETARERMELARDYLHRSLELNPADAYTWQFYAQALAATGHLAEARQAISYSWELAPTNRRLAFTRIKMIDALRSIDNNANAHSDIYNADKSVLEEYAPRYLEPLG